MPRTGCIFVFIGLTALAAGAFPQPAPERAMSHEQALQAIVSPDAATRAEAIAWIANRGGMQDAELLHQRLRDESPFVRGFAEQGLWLLWTRSGDGGIDRAMALASEDMDAGDYAHAIDLLTEVTRKMPAYAEGWNRRATVYYLAGEYEKSIADCREVLKRNPKHFGALSGMGQIYVRLEQYEEALKWFRRALQVNPNMHGVEVSIKQLEEQLKKRRIET
jgi:tetratricopeptide (TPR) repeat protein